MMKADFGLDTSQKVAWVLALALTGCGGGGSTGDTGGTGSSRAPQQEIALLEANGKLPVLEREPTLGGIDANTNGVRDDIEQYIEKKYSEPAQRKAAMQTARAYQQMLFVEKSDALALERVSQASWRAIGCEQVTFPTPAGAAKSWEMAQEIKAMTTNTKERLKALLAYNKARSGSVSRCQREVLVIDRAASDLSRWPIALFLLSFACISNASQDQCERSGVVFGYFNGVQTLEDDAQRALHQHIEIIYGTKIPAGDAITYDLFYNDTQGFADFVETFDQRLNEHGSLLAGRF